MLNAALIAALLLALLGRSAAAAEYNELFLRYEAQSSTYELAFARLGEERAVRPDVRAYAASLVNDHEALASELRDLARSKGIVVPSALAPTDRKRLDRLAKTTAAGFDAAFIREALRSNGEYLRTLLKEASDTTDPDIQAFVAHTLALDERHNAGARALAMLILAATAPAIPPWFALQKETPAA